MQQLAFKFDVRHARAPGKRRRGLRLEGRPVRQRDIKPANIPPGYRPEYEARLAAALARPAGAARRAALTALHDPAPFDLAADLREEAEALGWLSISYHARADQGAE